jgi:hypothetical protein
MGAAHVTTRRLFNKLDYEACYITAFTSRVLDYVRIPCIMESDREALQFALMSCSAIDKASPRIVRIENTGHVDTIWISAALIPEAQKNPALEIVGKPENILFDKVGNLW